MVLVKEINQNNGNFDQFEFIVGIIPNLFALSIFCSLIIYFDQTRKAKVKSGERVSPHQWCDSPYQ